MGSLHTRTSKNQLPVMLATLLHAKPQYAHERLPSDVETTMNICEISPYYDSVNENNVNSVGVWSQRVCNSNNYYPSENKVLSMLIKKPLWKTLLM